MVGVICQECDCERAAILAKGKKRKSARDLAIYQSKELTGERGVDLGRYFGGISGAGIVARRNHVANRMEIDRKLKRLVDRIRKNY